MKKLLLVICLFYCKTIVAQYMFQGFDLNPGTGGSDFGKIWGVNNNRLFFIAKNDTSGGELFVSDGTVAGTHITKDICPGSCSSYPFNNIYPAFFPFLNGELYARAYTPAAGYELWKSDGTTAGTQLVKDIRPGIQNGDVQSIVPYKGKMYFSGNSGIPPNSIEPWISDGTTAGTTIFADLCHNPFLETTNPSGMRVYNGKLYFRGNDPDTASKEQIWVTDGVPANTVTTNIYPLFSPDLAVEYNGKLYYSAADNKHAPGIYSTDGTAAGTQLVKQFNTTNGGSPVQGYFCLYNGRFYFAANDSAYGTELWASDGTTAGTVMIKDLNTGKTSGNVNNLTEYNGKLYFSGFDTTVTKTGNELWVTDGTAAGTQLVKDINPGMTSTEVHSLTVYANRLFFIASDGVTGYHLHYTDGTAAGTQKTKPAWSSASNPLSWLYADALTRNLIVCNNALYFYAHYDSIGTELWKLTDTTASGIDNHFSNANSFSLYPNPNNGTFTLQLANADFKNATVAVYDMMGREVYQIAITKQQTQITLNAPKGIYMVKLQLDGATCTKRVVVE